MSDTVKKITLDDLEAKVRELAKARPDFIYEQESSIDCTYVHKGGKPGCIFGHALLALGVSPVAITDEVNPVPITTALELLSVSELVDEEVFVFSPANPKTLLWMASVQAYQDGRTPWGRAVALADADVCEAEVLDTHATTLRQ